MSSSDASWKACEKVGQGNGWRLHLSLLVLALLALLILYRDAFSSLVYMWWTEGTYSHGILIFPISLYLIWEKRHQLSQTSPRFSWLPLIFILLTSALWLAGHVIHARMVEHFAVISFFALFVWLFLGRKVLEQIVFPLFFLYLSIPVWDPVVTPILQAGTANIVYHALSFFGVPILLDGHFLTIPEGVFEVARTCAGTRYFIAGFTLSLLYAYLIYKSFLKRILFVSATIVLCLLVNCLRVVLVVMAGHLTNMEHPWVEDHITMGWVLFALFIVPFFWYGMRYQDTDGSAYDLSKSSNFYSANQVLKGASIFIMTLVALASGPALAEYLEKESAKTLAQLHLEPPKTAYSWRGPFPEEDSWQPLFVGADAQQMNRYVLDGATLHYFVAKYVVQKQGKELADSKVYDRETWFQKPGGETHLYEIDGIWPYQVQETVIQSTMYGDKVVWQWYSVAGHETASPKWAKLLELAKLFEDGKTSSTVVLAVDGSNLESARQLMAQFLKDVGSEIKASLVSN